LLELLISAKRDGKRIVGYGAPGKGNTLLNYCGIRTDFIDFTVDRNPYKHGKFLPGTHIPIFEPSRLEAAKPDYIFILPWNFKEEIMVQLASAREWGPSSSYPFPRRRSCEVRRARLGSEAQKVTTSCGWLLAASSELK